MRPLLTLLLLVLPAAAAEPPRVGTLNERVVALAYYRSAAWSKTMSARQAEMLEAKRVNDVKKIEELDRWGAKHQEMAHTQVFGSAPIPNIIEALGPAFPEIASEAGVDVILTGPAYIGAAVRKIDVTGYVVKWLKLDEKSAKMVREFEDRMPAPVEEPHKH